MVVSLNEYRDMKQEKVIRKILSYEDRYEDDYWPPLDAYGFIDWFHRKISDVPEEFRDGLTISIGYDGGYCTIEFAYTRMETDYEEADREKYILSWEAVSGYPIGTWSKRDE